MTGPNVTEARDALHSLLGKVRCVPDPSRRYLIAEVSVSNVALLKQRWAMTGLVAGAGFSVFAEGFSAPRSVRVK
jgi:hypothetical protein